MSTRTSAQTLQVRTNIFCNEKFNLAKGLVKGNASPLTTQAGRISAGQNGVIWAGKLNGWSVFIDEDREWSSVMADSSSSVCGLVGIVVAALQSIEVIDEDASEEEIQEVVQTLLDTDVIFEIPTLKDEDLLDLYDARQDNQLYIQSNVELSIGLAKNGGLSIKGVFVGDVTANPGKLSLVESNRLQIGAAFSSFARSQERDLSAQRNGFKAALKAQRQQNLDRKANFAKKSMPAATETTSAGVEIPALDSALPPAI